MWSPLNPAWGSGPGVGPLTSCNECGLLSTLLVLKGGLGSKLAEKAVFWQLILPEWEEYWWGPTLKHTHRHTRRHRLSSGVTICNVFEILTRGNRTGDIQDARAATRLSGFSPPVKRIWSKMFNLNKIKVGLCLCGSIEKHNALSKVFHSAGHFFKMKYFQRSRCTNRTVKGLSLNPTGFWT